LPRSALILAVCVGLATATFAVSTTTRRQEPSQGRLTTPITLPFGASLPATTSARPYTFGSIPICLDKVGTVQIDSVAAVNSQGGLSVSGFAVRPLSPSLFGSQDRALVATGFNGTDAVSQTCRHPPGGADRGVESPKHRDTTARADGILVYWHNESERGEVEIPFHIVLCEGPDETIPTCQAFPQADS
jgi:hypothetical protein